MSRRFAAAGFTLIEVLVAVALLAVVGVLGYRGLDQIRLAGAAITREAEAWQGLSGVFARLAHDLNQALSPALAPETRPAPAFWTQGVAERANAVGNEFSFLRPAPADGEVQRIAYRFERTAAGQGAWLMLIWPGRDAIGEPRRAVLLDGIENADFATLDSRGQWWTQWPASWQQSVPRALRVTLTLADRRQITRVFDLPVAD